MSAKKEKYFDMMSFMFILNCATVLVMITGVTLGKIYGNNLYDTYIVFGPNENLVVLSILVDTWWKYTICTIALVILAVIDSIISQTVMNTVYNDVWNASTKNVLHFTSEGTLQAYAQIMYTLNAIRYILSIKVQITQIDLALITTAATQLMTIWSLRKALAGKTFVTKNCVRPYNINEALDTDECRNTNITQDTFENPMFNDSANMKPKKVKQQTNDDHRYTNLDYVPLHETSYI